MTKKCIEIYIKDWNEKRYMLEVNKIIGRRTKFYLGGVFTFQYLGNLNLFVNQLDILKLSDIYILSYKCMSSSLLKIVCKRLLTDEIFEVECLVDASKRIDQVRKI